MIDNVGRITGVSDWENAGWYPDYWEYANITKPSVDRDWMAWIDSTKVTMVWVRISKSEMFNQRFELAHDCPSVLAHREGLI